MSCAAKLLERTSRAPEDTALCHGVLDTLAAAVLPLLKSPKSAGDLIVPLTACAKAGYWRGGVVEELLKRLSAGGWALVRKDASSEDPKQRSLLSQDHSNLWWSLSVAPPGLRSGVDQQVLLQLSTSILPQAPIEKSQDCSNILLACARLKLNGAGRLAHHLTARLVELAPVADYRDACQSLANSLYALGELAEDVGHKPRPEDLKGLAREVVARLPAGSGRDSFKPQELSNMLYACAKLGHTDPALIQPLASAASRAALRMTPQGLANSGWALAKMGGKTQEWSNLWYALALARHRPNSRKLLELTAEAAALLRESAKPQACANLLLALANLRLYDERLVDALAGRLGELLRQDPKQLIDQGLCNSLWALAVMGPDVLSRHSGLVEGLLREAVRRWEAECSSAFGKEDSTRLWQVQLELEAMGGGELRSILGAGKGREGSLLSAARAVLGVRMGELTARQSTTLETEVASALEQLQQRMGPGAIVSVQRRCVVEEVGRYVEAVVELAGGRCVAVVTAGKPEHFANDPHRCTLTGVVELRVRQLGRVPGFSHVRLVPYWEWEEAKAGGEAGQRAYLCRLLGLGAA
ncbi:hypothetical protein HYH03_004200 [Edaphochlamys debaryana]|uniref:RAP domain-containing protein n=1 Tax=Edaphochlamys debaryana TaxID=47281 RepID=A0A836C3L1_9CHLO|nr:hypothetical protein HYH03_004200 [Edaphochlamys debaryana]|eukprot:KAG2497938.1 hypothetical protein HYH03_004200 [Edaphochlamys debaryana]